MSIKYTIGESGGQYAVEEKWKQDSFFVPETTSRTTSEVSENLEDTPTGMDTYRFVALNDTYKAVNFSYMQSSLFATVLEDAITQFRILAGSNNELKVYKTLDDIDLLRSLKYDIEQPAAEDELDGINYTMISSDTYKLQKLDNDRQQFGDTLVATYLELSKNRNWRVLAEKIKVQTDIYDYRAALADEEIKNRVTRREIARQLRQLCNHIKSVNYDTNIIIEKLRSKVEDSALNAEMRSRYTENWERARYEQHTQVITDAETPPSDTMEIYKQRIDQEQRAHVEIEMLVNITVNETLRQIEDWMTKYDKDIESVDLRIQIKKNEYEITLERREELEQTLEIHESEMKSWIQFKEEREKARLHREKMHKSACIVQAWWRGILVRFQLGPFKVAKKPGKTPAKKKK